MIGYHKEYSYFCPVCNDTLSSLKRSELRICPNCWIKYKVKNEVVYDGKIWVKNTCLVAERLRK